MIGFLYVFLLSSVVVDATLSDGQLVSGELNQIAKGRLVVATDTQPREFSYQDVAKLAFQNEPFSASVDRGFTELRDGTVLRTQSFRTKSKGKEAVVGEALPVVCPLALVRSVRFFGGNNNGELIEQWNEITVSVASDDFLVVNKNGNLDYLAGLVLGVTPDAVEFNYGGQNLTIPIAKVAGLVFAKKPKSSKPAKMVLTTVDKSVWQLDSLTTNDNLLQLVSVGGARQQLPLSEVESIEFVRAGVVYLTDLVPASMDYSPYLGSSNVGDSLRALGLPQGDVSFDGGPLRVATAQGETREFKRGLAMQSRSEIVYRLAKKYQRFQATVGFDPSASAEGSVELRLFMDDQEIFGQSMLKTDSPVAIDISVANVNCMKILVDYGQNMDIGDRLHLGDARLTK